jgi:hypothetical protein
MVTLVRAPAHAAENEQVKEVHAAQDEEHHADLERKGLDALFGVFDGVAELQRKADVTEVD